MITVDDLKAAIAECQGERNPNANTCMKLAAYYTILRELEPDKPSYSHDSAPVLPVKEMIGYYSETEFGQALQGKETSSVMKLVDELVSTISVIQPRLYAGFMRRLNEL